MWPETEATTQASFSHGGQNVLWTGEEALPASPAWTLRRPPRRSGCSPAEPYPPG